MIRIGRAHSQVQCGKKVEFREKKNNYRKKMGIPLIQIKNFVFFGGRHPGTLSHCKWGDKMSAIYKFKTHLIRPHQVFPPPQQMLKQSFSFSECYRDGG